MNLLVPGCPVPDEGAGVGPRTGEALADRLPHMCCLWLLYHMVMVGAGSTRHQGRGQSGWEAYTIRVTLTTAPPSRATSPSAETSKNQFSLQLSSVTTEDTALCCCARDTVRRRQCEPRHHTPSGGSMTTSGCWGHTIVCCRSRCRW